MTDNRWPLKALKYAVLGLLSLALITEVSLRVMGLSGKLAGTAFGYSRPAGSRLVLCEGGSMVWGVDGQSFPLQLQGFLDKQGKGRFAVLNRGVPGANFAQTFSRVKVELGKYRPDFVVYVPPNNDYWNKNGSFRERLEARLLNRLYLYRLYAYLAKKQETPPEYTSELLSDGSVFETMSNSALGKTERPWTLPVIGRASGSAMSALMLTFSMQALQAGQPGAALQSAREALRLDPESEGASVAVLRALAASGSYAKAAEMASQLCMEHPASVDALGAGGYALLKAGQPDKAVQLLYRAEALGGQDSGLFEHTAMAWMQKCNYYEAGAAALRGLKVYPGSARLKELLVRAYLAGGKLKQALTVLKGGGDENMQRAFFDELSQSGDLRSALYAASLFARKGNREDVYADMAAPLVRAQNVYAALETLEAAHKRGFKDWRYHAYMAALLHRLCRWDDATFHVAKAIEMEPKAWFPRFVAGSIAAYAGNSRAALKLLSKAQALSPGSAAPSHLKARVLWRQGAREDALSAYEQALAAAPADTGLMREYAHSSAQCGALKRVAGLAAAVPGVEFNPVWREIVKGEQPVLPDGVLPGQDSVLARNLAEIKNLCARYGTILITGSYPGIEFMQPAAAAEQAGIPFVDVPALLAARYSNRTDYLALDGSHFNAAGNRVMAEGFASAIEKSASGK